MPAGPVALGLAFLVLSQLAHAVMFAGQHWAYTQLVQRYFPGRLRGRGQALYTTLGDGFSGVLGCLGGGCPIDSLGYTPLFLAAAGAGALAAWCTFRDAACDRL